MFFTRKYKKENGVWVEHDYKITDWEDWEKNDKRKYHYVAYAIPGLTYAAAYFCNTSINDYKDLFYTINSRNEAGTLYPQYKATFLPVHRANYYQGSVEHRKNVTEEEKRSYYRDVDKANTMMCADTIALDFRDLDLLLELFIETRIAQEELLNNPYLRTIIVLSDF